MRENLIRFALAMLIASPALYFILQLQDKTLKFLLGLLTGIIAANIVIYWRTR